jgi:Ca-activated chloride channel homolog
MRKVIFPVLFCLFFVLSIQAQKITQGKLEAVGTGGKSLGACPLKNTKVEAEISGFLSRVKVTQEFENTFSEKIEAVYVFPLPNNAAVDDLTMKIGERTIRGKIMKREEAREVYEAAKSNGQIASLLDQERTNIFTQSVANILPNEKVTIEISYVETLKYEDGQYEFVFPMVVGPRYIPGSVSTTEANKISPPVATERAGHDISINVKLDAGISIDKVESKSHQIESAMLSANSYNVKLKDEKTIPNKDFILRYDVAGKKIEDAILTHRSEKGGYFTLILQPPDSPRVQDVTPKEIVFVVDTSGSMSGFPLDKAKESMKMALDGLNPQDTFNLITFAGDTAILFEKPVSATPANLKKAQAFLESRQGGGGTEMMKAIKAALDPSDSQQHRLFYDRRLCRQRTRNLVRNSKTSECANFQFRHRQFGQSNAARQNG